MTRQPNTVVGLAAAKQRLLDAHRALAVQGGDLGELNEVLAVALELDGMLRTVGEELRHARSTAAGQKVRIAALERDVWSAEEELGRLRPENAALRERVRWLEAAAVLDGVPPAA